VTDSPFSSFFRRSSGRRLAGIVCLVGLLLLGAGKQSAEAQRLRVDVGGGWAFPTNNAELSTQAEATVQRLDRDGNVVEEFTDEVPLSQPVDLKGGRHVYVGVGFVRSIGENFALGGRLRAHTSELQSTVDCRFDGTCESPSGTLRAATVEGRIILTSPDWVDPYLLVGLGVVQTSVDGVTLREVESETIGPDRVIPVENEISFSEVSVVDAGGDVGLGAAFPLTDRLNADVEVRVSGSLPGGKENAVTVLPLTLGLSYSFR
jgi:opacity protein-like surface antigen